MGLRGCPRCGATYLGTVAVCADCRVPLDPVDEAGVVTGDAAPAPAGSATVDLAADDAVGYDLGDWSDQQQAELSSALLAEGLPYTWDVDELVVHERHADAVEDLVDEIDHPDALDADDTDGDETGAQLLSDLFVASDVLAGDPDNRAAVTEMLQAAESLEGVAVPFGVDRSTWSALAERVDRLTTLLGDDADDTDVAEAARAVRDLLRPLV